MLPGKKGTSMIYKGIALQTETWHKIKEFNKLID